MDNPDTVRFGGAVRAVTAAERIDLLVETVKHETMRESASFEGDGAISAQKRPAEPSTMPPAC